MRLLRHAGEKLPRKLKKKWRKQIIKNFHVSFAREYVARISLYYSRANGWTAEYIPSPALTDKRGE